MSEKLIIEKLGPIGKLEIEPRPLTVLIGEQASGKSLTAQALYFFRGLNTHLALIQNPYMMEKAQWQALALTEILDGLRGVPFHHFANSRASLWYRNPSAGIDWKIMVNEKKGTVAPFKALRIQMQQWVDLWAQDMKALTEALVDRQVFIPTERSLLTRLLDVQPSAIYSEYQPAILRRFADLLHVFSEFYREKIVPLPALLKEQEVKNLPAEVKPLLFLMRLQLMALGGLAYVPPKGPKKWNWVVKTDSRLKELPIQGIAAGQMEAWPFFVLAMGAAIMDRSIDFYFEEPETHLHPRAQWEVMKAIAYLVTTRRHRFVITTHSPFIAYVLNNMIQRYISYKRKVPAGQLGLSPDMVAAYRLKARPEDPPEDIMDRSDTGLIKLDELDTVANELGKEFDELLDMEE